MKKEIFEKAEKIDKKEVLSVSIPFSILSKIDELCEEYSLKRSTVVETILKDFFTE